VLVDVAVVMAPGLHPAPGVGGPVPARGDRRGDPPHPVPFEPGHVPVGVRGGDQLAVLVVPEPEPDAGRVGHRGEQAAVPAEPGQPALGVPQQHGPGPVPR
jgi:hypothetical protein